MVEQVGDIFFKDVRFDPDLIEFHNIAKDLAKSVGYTADLQIDNQLAQLLRLRVTQMNPCSYCQIIHTQAANDRGIHPAKIAHLSSWRESTMFSDEEQAALAYAEALIDYKMEGFQSLHDALTKFFDQRAIAEIAAVVCNMTMWVRFKLAQGQTPYIKEE